MTKPSLWASAALLFAASCTHRPEPLFSKFVDIDREGMVPGWCAVFDPLESDTSWAGAEDADILLVVRYNLGCSAREALLDVEYASPQFDTIQSQSARLTLFNADGRPAGNGVYGLYELTDTLMAGTDVPKYWTLTLSTPLTAAGNRGLKSVGVVIVPHGQAPRKFIELL